MTVAFVDIQKSVSNLSVVSSEWFASLLDSYLVYSV